MFIYYIKNVLEDLWFEKYYKKPPKSVYTEIQKLIKKIYLKNLQDLGLINIEFDFKDENNIYYIKITSFQLNEYDEYIHYYFSIKINNNIIFLTPISYNGYYNDNFEKFKELNLPLKNKDDLEITLEHFITRLKPFLKEMLIIDRN